jgi:hypothetical protein
MVLKFKDPLLNFAFIYVFSNKSSKIVSKYNMLNTYYFLVA